MDKKFLIALTFVPAFCFGQKNISVDEAKELIDKNPKIQIVDVRTAKEYESGHIEGALNIDWKDPNFAKNIMQLKKKKPILIYCRSGRRSLAAMNKMTELGFKETYNMEGGILVWGQKYELK
ncbi:MAG: rhodanese-like domain-containing protein [Paludibacteraceae bacterium]|nr:rhodanese-like domain-containing protein [Paludibacteraceae bacterium]MEE3483782.1 rhodanese-like domain-containing protein [Bacteroidales bacterium]